MLGAQFIAAPSVVVREVTCYTKTKSKPLHMLDVVHGDRQPCYMTREQCPVAVDLLCGELQASLFSGSVLAEAYRARATLS